MTFTNEERAAMKDHARELKASARRDPRSAREQDEQDVLAKIAELPEADRVLAERLHALITTIAPELSPKTWYGMPAYARDGAIICHFQSAHKFKSRYATLGFSDKARLGEGEGEGAGDMWPVAFAIATLTPASEARITELVRKALG